MNLEQLKNITEESTLLIVTKTLVKLNKKDKEGNKNELGEIFKTCQHKVVVNRSYQAAVNEALKAEGKEANFVAQERNWKESSQSGCVIEKNGENYLSCIVLSSGVPVYTNSEDEVITKEVFQAFMPTKKPSSNNGGVDARTFKFSSIISVESASE